MEYAATEIPSYRKGIVFNQQKEFSMVRLKMSDKTLAFLFIRNRTTTESIIATFIGSLLWAPLNALIFAVNPSELGMVVMMHFVLGVVAWCAVKPFTWVREEVFFRTPRLVHRFGHFVLSDKMERWLSQPREMPISAA